MFIYFILKSDITIANKINFRKTLKILSSQTYIQNYTQWYAASFSH